MSAPSDATTFVKGNGLCSDEAFADEISMMAMDFVVPATGNDHDWSEQHVYVYLFAEGQTCTWWGDHVGLDRLRATLSVADASDSSHDPLTWMAGMTPSFATSNVATAWPAAVNEMENTSDGAQKIPAAVSVEWNPEPSVLVNVSFPVATFDYYAQAFWRTRLRFTITLGFAIGETACSTRCWSPFFDTSVSAAASDEAFVIRP